jgi:hypothetical protein
MSKALNLAKVTDGVNVGVNADLVRGGEPVKLNGDSITKTDGSFIKNQCSSWVIFDGTNGNIIDSFNVASVSRDDVGKYTVTFATALDNTNYVAFADAEKWDSNDDGNIMGQTQGCTGGNKPTVNNYHIVTIQGQSLNLRDCKRVVSITFGGKN